MSIIGRIPLNDPVSDWGDMDYSNQWTNVRTEFPGGFIVMVSAESPENEKRAVAKFSEQTKHLLGYDGFDGRVPFLTEGSWYDALSEGPQPQVCVAIMGSHIVGYSICR